MDSEQIIERLEKLTRQADDLSRQMVKYDLNDDQIREKLAEVAASVKRLEVVVFGEPKYRLIGTAESLEKLAIDVREIISDRKSERDKLRGLQIGLGVTSVGSLVTMATVLSQVFGG